MRTWVNEKFIVSMNLPSPHVVIPVLSLGSELILPGQKGVTADWVCSICTDIFHEPCFLRNGMLCGLHSDYIHDNCKHCEKDCMHEFCKKCITTAVNNDRKCPLCKKISTIGDIRPDSRCERVLDELLIKCPHQECPWTGVL